MKRNLEAAFLAAFKQALEIVASGIPPACFPSVLASLAAFEKGRVWVIMDLKTGQAFSYDSRRGKE